MRVVLVAAARPNFMKVAPVLRALEQRGVEVLLVHTGQHHDAQMSDAFFRELDLRQPDFHLHCGGGSHAVQTAAVMTAFEPLLADLQPHSVVVCGDVNSTLACALVAAKASVPIAHVESGLRSRDRSMPEEVNRIAVDHLSDWLLTPSADADENLAREGISGDRVWRVGNVMVDSLLHNRRRAEESDVLERLGVTPGHALLTLHRPSNVDVSQVLTQLVGVAVEVAQDRQVVFPVHPRTGQRLKETGLMSVLEDTPGVVLAPPLGYLDCIRLQDTAAVVLTDSGGVQEETTVLGVPCLTLRESTERPITVSEGTNTVVGTNPGRILEAYRDVQGSRPSPRRPEGWDGRAAERIAGVLTTVSAPLADERPEVALGPVHLDPLRASSARQRGPLRVAVPAQPGRDGDGRREARGTTPPAA